MTTVGGRPAPAPTAAAPVDWVAALSMPGPEQERAIRELHGLLVYAARRQVHRMGGGPGRHGGAVADELANQAADEALVAILGKLHTFEGRSRFTTWAYKFAVLHAANAVRAAAWRGREIQLEGLELVADRSPEPGQYAEAAALADTVRGLLETELSPYQRRVVIALLVDEVPIDVLADRLGTNRNALYKTLHDARSKLRRRLDALGYLAAATGDLP
ncbi:MAG TPA: sigma-70 family RNA polymerase sigma factor [Nocardioides sp.]|uniref:RNA polymerase sigma factor n=1 Tax=Nocardioides sp. TaxID=35761 RepID=UPI002F42146B